MCCIIGEEQLEISVKIDKSMIFNESDDADISILFDQREETGKNAPPMGMKKLSLNAWKGQKKTVQNSYIDLKEEKNISSIWLYDSNGGGQDFVISYGSIDNWKELFRDDCIGFKIWKPHSAEVKTRYLRFTKTGHNANISEIVIYEIPSADYPRIARVKKKKKSWDLSPEPVNSVEVEKALTSRKFVDAGEPFGKLPMIDEVSCGDELDCKNHEMKVYPKNGSKIENILGKKCRILPNSGGKRYMSFRMGRNSALKAGKAYLIALEFPEDKPRTMFIINMANEAVRGFHTGNTVGDVFFTYTENNLESMKIPLSKKYNTWKQLFYMHDRYAKINRHTSQKGMRVLIPGNGFNIIICQSRKENAPESAGAAVTKIRLFEVPNPKKYYIESKLPNDLPKRRLFYRQEMAVSTVNNTDIEKRGVNKVEDWYEYKMRLMKFLGMNTYTKPLMVFGRCQGWDTGDPDWYVAHKFPWLWRSLLPIAKKYDLDVLPYLEFSGGTGRNGIAGKCYAHPLGDKKSYTHIKWAELFNLDLTHPDALDDAKKMLRCTLLRHRNLANFAGIWLRPRVSQIPISFSQEALDRFVSETGKKEKLKRKMLRGEENKKLLNEYYAWWYEKRKEFLLALRDYMRNGGIKDAQVLYTAYVGEVGPGVRLFKPGKRKLLVTDDVSSWKEIFKNQPYKGEYNYDPDYEAIPFKTVLKEELYLKTLLTPRFTWGNWEWQHACPRPDPLNYKNVDGIMMSYPYNRLYTTASAKAMDAFRNMNGLAMVRHYPLNENVMGDDVHGKKSVLGYFVSDVEYAGPYCMASEAMAIANGDPVWLGYLSSNTFNRGFPEYARKFNSAFLSLPALPSKILKKASSDFEVVVREIKTHKHGIYLAIVNMGWHDKKDIIITLPVDGKVSNPVNGKTIIVSDNKLNLSFYPCELKTIRIE
ncbi:MAG: hypothetical protein U9O87_00390 [Verrucomicrobiota bacterium]|nr:hypothetical protein [Verrucomicrobiota bacterium]